MTVTLVLLDVYLPNANNIKKFSHKLHVQPEEYKDTIIRDIFATDTKIPKFFGPWILNNENI